MNADNFAKMDENYDDIHLDSYKIILFTRSMNPVLFDMSDSLLDIPFRHIPLKNTSAISYFYELLKYDPDYAINIDEDAFLLDRDALLRLLKFCIKNDIVNCGIPDGGLGSPRAFNPVVTNPFFNIFNIKEIKKAFTPEVLNELDFTEADFERLLPTSLLRSPYRYVKDAEPYYSFFLWMAKNLKTYYLDITLHKDGKSWVVKDPEGYPFLCHSWYSRCWGNELKQTKRIWHLYKWCVRSRGKQVRFLTTIFYLKARIRIILSGIVKKSSMLYGMYKWCISILNHRIK